MRLFPLSKLKQSVSFALKNIARLRYSRSDCLFLQDDDAINAEAFINKASFLVSNSQNEVLNWTYKVECDRLWGWLLMFGSISIYAEPFFFYASLLSGLLCTNSGFKEEVLGSCTSLLRHFSNSETANRR